MVCRTSERPCSFPLFSVTMSSLLLILLLLVTAVCAQLQVTTSNAPITSEPGTTAVLQCMFSSGVTPVDPAQVHVFWKHDGKKVLSYVDTITAFRPGAHISKEQLAKGDASLSLPVVTQDDAGLYSCSIRLGSEQVTHAVNLIVSEFRHISLEGTTVVMNKSNELQCSANNLSSPDVTFQWMRDGAVLSTSAPQRVEGNDTLGFIVQSSFCFTPVLGDYNAHYSCEVVPKIFPPLKKTFQLTFGVQPEVFFYLSSNRQENSSLVCLVSGFYPDDLNLSMKKGGELLDCKIDKWRNFNGTYSLEAMYGTNVTYTDGNIEYTCSVHHSTIREVDTEIPAPFLVFITFIFLLYVGIKIFWREVTEIKGWKDWTEGSIATLESTITGRYSKNIYAVWLVRQGDEEIEIKEKQSRYPAGDYKELQEQDSYTCMNIVKSKFVGGLRHSLCSILSFQVHKQRHHQAEFICRFMKAGKVLREKNYFANVLDSCGFYSVSDICVPETCKEGEKLTLSCTMKGNIPQDISVTWEKGLKQERILISKELDTNYQVTESKSQGQICAFLTLCPTCEDSGAVFTVSFSKNEGRILAERSSTPLKVAGQQKFGADCKRRLEEFAGSSPVILGGDFNIPMNPAVDVSSEPKKIWSRTYQDWSFRAFD
ncbi:uncharacterized protein LOC143785349 isoform X2 [Ranitomeya variabilis]|uniref:uncharacterized protein LOC143785349 isoform X2 n=1 Tax=Ranitomeya variabilis TaxID=490064 RepID=UPI004055E2B4